MSYTTERRAIETYFATEWTSAYPSVPIGYDGHPFTPSKPSVRLTIQNGVARQIAFCAPGANRIEYLGVAQFNIFVAGDNGSEAWRPYAEAIEGLFRNVKLSASGTIAATAAEVLLVFGRGGQMPYVAGVQQDAPFTIATVNAPFARDEARA